jgi:hypothetical protein
MVKHGSSQLLMKLNDRIIAVLTLLAIAGRGRFVIALCAGVSLSLLAAPLEHRPLAGKKVS